MTTARQVIEYERQFLGYVESGGKDGRSGNRTLFGVWYGWDGVPWCAQAQSYALFQCGLPLPAQSSKGFASCELGRQWARKNGLWVSRPPYRAGDLLMYQFDKDPMADHIGLLVHDQQPGATTIVDYEGNTSPSNKGSQNNGGGFYQRTRNVSLVLGAIRPPYTPGPTLPATPPPKPNTKLQAFRRPLLLTSPIMRGPDVRAVQAQLVKLGGKLAVDGEYGPLTSKAVTAWQRKRGLVVDGIVGPVSWSALFAR